MKILSSNKGVLILLLGVDLLLASVPFVSREIDRPSAARAFYEWQRKPSPETEENWKAEAARLRRDNLIIDLTAIILFMGNSILIVRIWSKKKVGAE